MFDSFSFFIGLWCNELVHEHFPTVLDRFSYSYFVMYNSLCRKVSDN